MRSPCNVTATLLCLRPELVGISRVWPAEGTNTAAQHVQVPSTEQSTISGIFIRCIVAIFLKLKRGYTSWYSQPYSWKKPTQA